MLSVVSKEQLVRSCDKQLVLRTSHLTSGYLRARAAGRMVNASRLAISVTAAMREVVGARSLPSVM
jgi:hypothetical protein